MALPPPSLKARALRLLSAREHSRLELERKLASFEEQPGSLAAALDDLQAKGFISEERVLASVLHQRAPKWGAMRLKQALMRKGLEPEAVAQAMSELKHSEVARAQAVWRKKFGQAACTPTDRARQMRFLAGRGFSGDTIRRVLGEADSDTDEDAGFEDV